MPRFGVFCGLGLCLLFQSLLDAEDSGSLLFMGHRQAYVRTSCGSSACDKDPTVDVLQAVKILKMLRCLEFAGSLFPFDCESGAENNLDT